MSGETERWIACVDVCALCVSMLNVSMEMSSGDSGTKSGTWHVKIQFIG